MDKNRRVVNGVGVLFYTQSTKRVLYLLRNHKEQVWGIPGGKIERGESLSEALTRECREEIGYWPENAKLYPLDCYRSSDGKFVYHTFFSVIKDEFIVNLNDEHLAYAWSDLGVYPRPLHGGLFNTLSYDTIKQKIDIIINNLE